MSPEIAVDKPWRDIFTSTHFKKELVIVAIDEAHCIPQWLAVLVSIICAKFMFK